MRLQILLCKKNYDFRRFSLIQSGQNITSHSKSWINTDLDDKDNFSFLCVV